MSFVIEKSRLAVADVPGSEKPNNTGKFAKIRNLTLIQGNQKLLAIAPKALFCRHSI
jgi:hypothetical protein